MHAMSLCGLCISYAIVVVAGSTTAWAAKDDFNRAKLGKNWVVSSGSLSISKHQLQGSDMAVGYDTKSANDTTVSATVYLHGANLEYGAVTSGNMPTGNYAFVKIQSSDGKFGYGAFYVGNNGAGLFFQLDAPIPSPATLKLSFCGDVATMKIKSADGIQKYSYDYGQTFGTGGGLGTYGPVSLDNYKSKPGGCTDGGGAKIIRSSNARDPLAPPRSR
ncbi:MAG: hypothetical protein JO056_04590 [Alphaproteobacteria bacterium]|nr:hypothetical protein [Alphaproteobacteria bacterium]